MQRALEGKDGTDIQSTSKPRFRILKTKYNEFLNFNWAKFEARAWVLKPLIYFLKFHGPQFWANYGNYNSRLKEKKIQNVVIN